MFMTSNELGLMYKKKTLHHATLVFIGAIFVRVNKPRIFE